jgi:hypothetical protein
VAGFLSQKEIARISFCPKQLRGPLRKLDCMKPDTPSQVAFNDDGFLGAPVRLAPVRLTSLL